MAVTFSRPFLFFWWILVGWRHCFYGRLQTVTVAVIGGAHMGSLYGIWRASSYPGSSLPLPHLSWPIIPSCCWFFLTLLPIPPVSGAGWMTHALVTSMVFTGPKEHLLILTQTNVGIQNKWGCMAEVTSTSVFFFPLFTQIITRNR